MSSKCVGHVNLSTMHIAFTEPLPKRLECPICLDCLTEPVQTECGHRFCYRCLMRCLPAACGSCPLCRVPLRPRDDLHYDKAVQREIMQLTVLCPWDPVSGRCVLKLADLPQHRRETCCHGNTAGAAGAAAAAAGAGVASAHPSEGKKSAG